jgi:hypothetical protein
VNAQNVPTGMLVSYLQKGLQYREIETHLGEVRKNRQEQERKTREENKREKENGEQKLRWTRSSFFFNYRMEKR